jgi:Arc/MetJ-type ribon-helix-helix transcriptional regulator
MWLRLQVITVHLPEHYIEGLDLAVQKGLYPSRAEAIRFAIHDLLTYHGLFRRDKLEQTSQIL